MTCATGGVDTKILDVLLGIMAGTLTGLTPGVHVNTIAALGGSFGFLFSMGLTHTFLDAIPSAFLGVPEEGTALAILPAHRMVMRGLGREVIALAMRSSFLAVLFSAALYYPYRFLAPLYRPVYGLISVLILIILMLALERKAAYLLVLLISGTLGLVSLRLMNLRHPFFHLFTGLFGLPVLVQSLVHPGRIKEAGKEKGFQGITLSSLEGTLLGMLSSLIPAFTASQAAILATLHERNDVKFLSIVYSVNTANFMFSVFNYSLTGRVRNGVVAVMPDVPDVSTVLLTAMAVSSIVWLYGEYAGRLFMKGTAIIGQRRISLAVILLLLFLSLWFDGFIGLAVMLSAFLIGTMPQKFGVKRTACMGVIMIPLIATWV